MNYIEGKDANELFINLAKAMLTRGHKSNPRGLATIELQDAWLVLKDTSMCVCTLKSRAISKQYLNAEINWYLNGSYSIQDIAKASKFWYRIADENGNVNSNYGAIAFREVVNKEGDNQVDWCARVLESDKDSRQAIINYNQPKHKIVGTKDFVCTIAQLFRIVNDELKMNILVRSNDMIYGLTYDMPFFCLVQHELLARLSKTYPHLQPGEYNHYAASMHVYEKHFKMLAAIANDNPDSVPASNFNCIW